MILTYENLLQWNDFKFLPHPALIQLNQYAFLSFQDALHYLIKKYQWQGKTILVPAFYCDATLHDMAKHGLQVRLCKIDQKNFDIDLADFQTVLRTEKPDIILIYNFFGKNSVLYTEKFWLELITSNTVLISDFAHSLIPNHKIEFFTAQHFYIDSTRKTTCRMLANLIMPKEIQVDNTQVVKQAKFKYALRSLFFLKSWSLRFATVFHNKMLAKFGLWLYGLHDNWIGSPLSAYTGFKWDKFLYNRINFDKIRRYRKELYVLYQQALFSLANKHIQLFSLPEQETGNICFFFVRILDAAAIVPLVNFLNQQGVWAEVLWNFSAIQGISNADKAWAESIIVLPYTLRTKAKHIKKIAALIQQFYHARG